MPVLSRALFSDMVSARWPLLTPAAPGRQPHSRQRYQDHSAADNLTHGRNLATQTSHAGAHLRRNMTFNTPAATRPAMDR